jgi:competence protein ComEA
MLAGVATGIVVLSLAAWSRTIPASIAPPSVASSPVAPVSPLGSPLASPTAGGTVFVHVAGAVRRPGLYEVPEGTRVEGAIEAAGGPRPGADLDALNLAELVADGTKIEVPGRRSAAANGVPSVAPSATPTVPAVVNLNTADQAALETIPGVGPVTATAILQYRAEIGSFTSVEELLDVDGIGPATLESLRPYVTV